MNLYLFISLQNRNERTSTKNEYTKIHIYTDLIRDVQITLTAMNLRFIRHGLHVYGLLQNDRLYK